MSKVKESSCLGNYMQEGYDRCESCPAVMLCIDVTMAADNTYWDLLASREQEIEEMEADYAWSQW